MDPVLKLDNPETYTATNYRWVILLLFVITAASSTVQWTQYTIIQDIVVEYYGIDSTVVSWTSMVFMVTYIPCIIPASWLLNKTDLRVTTIIGAFATSAGAWLKLFSVPQNLFWLGFVGQTVVAISQVFIINLPSRLAAVWFGADQVALACSMGVLGSQLGVALGFLLPPMLVDANGTTDELAADFKEMFCFVAGFTSILFVGILLFFKAAPDSPPSLAADSSCSQTSNLHFLESIKKLLTNRNYILLLISYGLNVGTFYAISTLLNLVILTYYPGAHTDAGRIGLVIVVSGMIGSIVFGLVLDKTHKYKETTLAVYLSTTIGMAIFTFTLDCGLIGIVYMSSCFLGFFMSGYLSIGFEFASELTYPEPEGTTSGILNAVVQAFGMCLTLLYEYMLSAVGDRYANLTLCLFLALGTIITATIRSDLRRQSAQNKK